MQKVGPVHDTLDGPPHAFIAVDHATPLNTNPSPMPFTSTQNVGLAHDRACAPSSVTDFDHEEPSHLRTVAPSVAMQNARLAQARLSFPRDPVDVGPAETGADHADPFQ